MEIVFVLYRFTKNHTFFPKSKMAYGAWTLKKPIQLTRYDRIPNRPTDPIHTPRIPTRTILVFLRSCLALWLQTTCTKIKHSGHFYSWLQSAAAPPFGPTRRKKKHENKWRKKTKIKTVCISLHVIPFCDCAYNKVKPNLVQYPSWFSFCVSQAMRDAFVSTVRPSFEKGTLIREVWCKWII